MIRILLLGLCLATLAGCSSTRKTKVTSGPGPGVATPDAPKQYEYHDMSRGATAFRR